MICYKSKLKIIKIHRHYFLISILSSNFYKIIQTFLNAMFLPKIKLTFRITISKINYFNINMNSNVIV